MIYEFECKNCSTRVEHNENKLENNICSCGGELVRVYSVPTILWKSGLSFGNIYTVDGKRDTISEEQCKIRFKKIREIWKNNESLRKKIKKRGFY